MAGAIGIGWYGPLIDLSRAASHIGGGYVQLLVFVHNARPIQFKSLKGRGGSLQRTDVQVGDDTRSYFSVSIWHKQMASLTVSGDIILLQNVKIVRFGDVVEAGTVQFSSLVVLVHPYESLVSKGVEDLVSSCRVGVTAKEKLNKVIKWVRQTRGAHHCLQAHTIQRQQMANWKVQEERNIRVCSSIREVSCLNLSCKAVFSAFVGEIFLPYNGGSDKEFDEGMMFIRRRLFAKGDEKLAGDLICLGCKLCCYPMDLDDGSLLEENRFPLCCHKSSNRLHTICLIYRPFLLYVWDQSEFVPLLVTNKSAELLFGNITAERVHLCYEEDKKELEKDKHSKAVEGGVAVSKSLNSEGKLQPDNTKVHWAKTPNFHKIWLILIGMLLQQEKNSCLRFEINVNTGVNQENGRFELVSLIMPHTAV